MDNGKKRKGEGGGGVLSLTIFLSSSHHSGTKQLCNLASIKLDETQSIVAIVVLSQARFDSRDANGSHALDATILSEEPQGQIDIVDRTVHKDAAGELCVFDKEPSRVELVARLASKHGRDADQSGAHLIVGVAVRGVEAAREPADDFLGRVSVEGGIVGVDYGLGLFSPT